MNEHESRIKELEAENDRLKEELARTTEFKEGYRDILVQQEDWVQVEKEMAELMQNADFDLRDLIRELQEKGSQDAA